MTSSVACATSSFTYPPVFGTQFVDLTASPVTNFSVTTAQGDSHFAKNLTSLNFCNVSITYTHPGYNDITNVQIWLPEHWNGRFLGTGGGGFASGMFDPSLGHGISQGFAAASTDGAHSIDPASAASWALLSPGNVDLVTLQDFASTSLNDMTEMGKAITETFYQTPPSYSYWSGCSGGGRQGVMMAQRYPGGYDGILAAAPAINWASFLVAEYDPQFIMNLLGQYPPPCELDAITAAAIKECDALDGIADGIVSLPHLCNFDPAILVGQPFDCDGTSATITQAGATIADALWTGAKFANGSDEWFGLNYDAPLTGLASTVCTEGKSCTGIPCPIASDWIQYFVVKDATFDLRKLTRAEFDDVLHMSRSQYGSVIDTSDPSLERFRDLGGKMITWHGLADQLIHPGGTSSYYDRVRDRDPSITSFYRHFEAPGIYHCSDGPGAFPGEALQSLIAWVEDGIAPTTLNGTSLPSTDGTVLHRPICMYPTVQVYLGGDPTVESSFACVEAQTHLMSEGETGYQGQQQFQVQF
ncbi:hypothetical protein BP6252_08941 [Coleophoma cylindrospora]|uniref:Carboxylic ester hydrolase n=1 Tax=Coleophoma cylindrospora TaxID=1849047 RepID=A0A3D8R0L0_9HELO|nr:hypothetical protein BP6252_08941 [Coleophoma cylindrospora]